MATRCRICNTPIDVRFIKGQLDDKCVACKTEEQEISEYYRHVFTDEPDTADIRSFDKYD